MNHKPHALLIFSVTATLMALLMTPTASAVVVVAILIVLVTLIMVLGGAARYIPAVLGAVRDLLARLIL